MKLEQQVSSLEPSRRLAALGVKQESLYFWRHGNIAGWYLSEARESGMEQCSAFTVAELGEMLPKCLHVGIHMHDLTIIRSSVWRFYYGVNMADSVYLTTGNDDTEADARAKMLIYLIENKLITV